ncbi:hypothetical protein BH11PLA1_BH11PLA1_14220 [soil metagenome]
MPAPFIRSLSAASLAGFVVLTGCIPNPMKLETEMGMDMKMNMTGSFKMDGPITMNMQGPNVKFSGTFVTDTLYDEIKVKTTTREWVIAVIGEPDRRAMLEDGSELFVYAFRLESIESTLFSVVGGKDKVPSQSTTAVRLHAGLVVEKWRG